MTHLTKESEPNAINRMARLTAHFQEAVGQILQAQKTSGKTRMVNLTEIQEAIAGIDMVAIDAMHKRIVRGNP